MAIERDSCRTKHLPWAHLRLPPFPQVAVRVLQLANDENVSLHRLCDLVSSDPAFAGEVLTVTNSALYAPRYPVNSIQQAIGVLGATMLQGMCITVGARAYLGKSMSQPALRGLWRHNLACAIIAKRLASLGSQDEDMAYTLGIMHDLGRTALAGIQPREYAHLLDTHRGTPESILDGERRLFGWDHCEVGSRLIADWNLPTEYDAVVAEHHEPRATDGAWGMVEVVKISCRMANAVGFAAFTGCEAPAYEALLEELPERERKLFAVTLETLALDVANSIQAVESA
jgi:HD-like signal output (HDOD) protein